MHKVELTPAVITALDSASDDLRRRFFLVTDHLGTRPRDDDQPPTFYDLGEHFEIYRPPVILSGLFFHNLRVLYQPQQVRDERGEWANVIKVLSYSEGSSPLAGWDYAR